MGLVRMAKLVDVERQSISFKSREESSNPTTHLLKGASGRIIVFIRRPYCELGASSISRATFVREDRAVPTSEHVIARNYLKKKARQQLRSKLSAECPARQSSLE